MFVDRIPVAALAALAIATSVASVMAVIRQGEAEQARTLAENRLKEADEARENEQQARVLAQSNEAIANQQREAAVQAQGEATLRARIALSR